MIQRHYSISSLANLFDLSTDFWRKKIRMGEVKAVRLGGAIRVSESEVRKIVKSVGTISDIVDEILSENG